MTHKATGKFEVKGWDEKTWDGKAWNEQSGPRLTHAKVNQVFHGDIEGESVVQYLMAYSDNSYATFVGLQQITGRIGARSGSLNLQVIGIFENGTAKSNWTIIDGSGTGDLKGIKGAGSTIAEHNGAQSFTLDYDFE